MTSVFTFNGHAHDNCEVGVVMTDVIQLDQFRMPYMKTTNWTIIGVLQTPGASGDLQSDIDALEAAYPNGGQNLGDATLVANGNTHRLDDSAAFAGVRCVKFGWTSGPWKMGPELSNRRTFHAILRADFRFNRDVVGYREEIVVRGNGGPRFQYMPSLTGAPEKQTLQLVTTLKYMQRGVLLRRGFSPAPNPSKFGAATHQDRTEILTTAPKEISKTGSGQIADTFATHWTYYGESPVAIDLGTFLVPAI